MTLDRKLNIASSALVAAVSLAGMLTLSACEERPYPAPVKSYAPPPAAPPAYLAGAPATPPPAYVQPAPAYSEPTYSEPVYTRPAPQPYNGGEIIAMAPIPNPGDEGGYVHGPRHRVHATYATGSAPAYGAPGKPVISPKPYTGPKPVTPPMYAKAPPAPKPAPYKSAPVKPVTPPVVAAAPKPNTYTQKGAAVGAAAGAATGVVAKTAVPAAKGAADAAKAAYAAKATPPAGATPAAKVGDKTVAVAAGAAAGAVVAAKDAGAIIGALLGAAAGSTLAHSAEYDDNYTVVEQAPRPVYRPRFVDPGYDEAGFDEPSRPIYREAPRYRVVRDGWDREGYDGDRGFHRHPCPERDWRRAGDGW